MCDFTAGQKVRLVKDFDPDRRTEAPSDGIILPAMGEIYTIRRLGHEPDFGVVLFLVEVVNEEKFYLDAFKVMEQGFDPSRFELVAPSPEENVRGISDDQIIDLLRVHSHGQGTAQARDGSGRIECELITYQRAILFARDLLAHVSTMNLVLAADTPLLASLKEPSPTPAMEGDRPLDLLDPADDEAIDWVTRNLCAIRRDNGSMHYSLSQAIRAFQAGRATAVHIAQDEDNAR